MAIDLYGITPIEREEMGISSLPHDLFEAVRIAEGSDFLKDVLGPDVHRKLIETKLLEVDEFRLNVSALDLEKHMVL
jgi:glutamine synthetase